MVTQLAIDGGAPVRTAPFPTWPDFGSEELRAVNRVIDTGLTNYWTGSEGRRLEKEYAEHLGRAHSIALANGTVAIELALRALGVEPGSEVIIPARTFIGTASAVVAAGAVPVVADIEPFSGNITAETVEAVWSDRTRAVIPVHLCGWPADVMSIADLAHNRGAFVIEDCAQAAGGTIDGIACGNLGSDAATFSFYQDEIIPAGEGGLLAIDDPQAYERAWAYKDHGRSLKKMADSEFMTSPACFKYVCDSWGTNWRMHEVAAALARVGLDRLPEYHERRTDNAMRLAQELASVPGIEIPLPGDHLEHAFYRLAAMVEPEELAPGWDRDRILATISFERVPIQFGTCAEVYREGAFANSGWTPECELSGSRYASERSIAFFVYPTIEARDIDDIAEAVTKVMKAATGR